MSPLEGGSGGVTLRGVGGCYLEGAQGGVTLRGARGDMTPC